MSRPSSGSPEQNVGLCHERVHHRETGAGNDGAEAGEAEESVQDGKKALAFFKLSESSLGLHLLIIEEDLEAKLPEEGVFDRPVHHARRRRHSFELALHERARVGWEGEVVLARELASPVREGLRRAVVCNESSAGRGSRGCADGGVGDAARAYRVRAEARCIGPGLDTHSGARMVCGLEGPFHILVVEVVPAPGIPMSAGEVGLGQKEGAERLLGVECCTGGDDALDHPAAGLGAGSIEVEFLDLHSRRRNGQRLASRAKRPAMNRRCGHVWGLTSGVRSGGAVLSHFCFARLGRVQAVHLRVRRDRAHVHAQGVYTHVEPVRIARRCCRVLARVSVDDVSD
mmetsp:Transcript_28008/g.66215  ORF Transcript_28008/g.66215 Transcript_28008/m.66215 type:complete len:343 (-) Transcript_28008:312-1340(-)